MVISEMFQNQENQLPLLVDIKLILPLDFAKKWIKSKIEQTWTANIVGAQTEKSETQTLETETHSSDSVGTCFTTSSIMRNATAFVCISFTSVQLCSTGKLELIITDIEPKVTGNIITGAQASTEEVDKLQSHRSGKRKRGRPCKVMQDLPVIATKQSILRPVSKVESNTCSLTPSPTRSRYNLRAKKFPVSVSDDSGSDTEKNDTTHSEEYDECRIVQCSTTGVNPSNRDDLTFGCSLAQNALESKVRDVHLGLAGSCAPEKKDERNEDRSGAVLMVNKRNNSESACEDTSWTGPNESDIQTQRAQMDYMYCNETGLVIKGSQSPLEQICSRGQEPEQREKKVSNQKKIRLKIDTTGLPSYARRRRTNSKTAMCKYCRRKFCDYTGVQMHVKKFHSSNKDLGQYLLELKQLSTVKCLICDKQFDNRIRLQLHEDKVHIKVGEIPCRLCGKVFGNLSLVKQHVRYVHQQQGQPHACASCPARFKIAGTLKDHIRDVHHGEKNVSCSVCGKLFYRVSQLNRHVRIHVQDHSKLACQQCGRKFTFLTNLKRHVDIVHCSKNRETHHCAYCGKGFQRKECLQNHLEKIHFSIFPYHCPICSAGFGRAPGLEKHMAVVHSEPGFKAPAGRPERFKYNRNEAEGLVCYKCDQRFFIKAQLVDHVTDAHREEFQFHCGTCPQVFVEKTFLVNHLEKAHGIKPDLEDPMADTNGQLTGLKSKLGAEYACTSTRRRSISFLPDKTEAQSSGNSGEAGDGKEIAPHDRSFIIRVELGGLCKQYVIQQPTNVHSTLSEAVIQSTAQLMVTSEEDSVFDQVLRAVGDQIAVDDPKMLYELYDGDVCISDPNIVK